MSRHNKNLMGGGSLTYGYDPPTWTYFYQVFDKDGEAILDVNCTGAVLSTVVASILGVDANKEHLELAMMDMAF